MKSAQSYRLDAAIDQNLLLYILFFEYFDKFIKFHPFRIPFHHALVRLIHHNWKFIRTHFLDNHLRVITIHVQWVMDKERPNAQPYSIKGSRPPSTFCRYQTDIYVRCLDIKKAGYRLIQAVVDGVTISYFTKSVCCTLPVRLII